MNSLHHPGSPKAPWRRLPACDRWRRLPACDRCPSLQPAIASRPAFTLTELLIVISIILLLVTLLGSAVSAARSAAKISSTRATIEKLSTILMAQLAKYDSASVSIPNPLPLGISSRSGYRSWHIRRNLISGDMPDNWRDVELLASGTASTFGGTTLPMSGPQRAYAAFWNGMAVKPNDVHADAECLFMIVMRGGIADCLDCGSLKTTEVGDKDGDGANEFWDAWGNPIRFVLWPVGLELPAGSGSEFFSGARAPQAPFSGSPSPTLGLRPLIFSDGPDQRNSITVNAASNISSGVDCGNPANATVKTFGALFVDSQGDARADNITNFDAEAKQ